MKKKVDWNKIKLTLEEQKFDDEADHYVDVGPEEFAKIKESINQWKKDSVLNMRMNAEDLGLIKAKAKKLGVRYQTFIAEVLHRLARS